MRNEAFVERRGQSASCETLQSVCKDKIIKLSVCLKAAMQI